jgi:hypothetical protein
LIPLSTLPAQQLLKQARSWIEPSQAFEKNLLGLNGYFLNSLRLTWFMGLIVDAASLLRTLAAIEQPPEPRLLDQLLPRQTHLDLNG